MQVARFSTIGQQGCKVYVGCGYQERENRKPHWLEPVPPKNAIITCSQEFSPAAPGEWKEHSMNLNSEFDCFRFKHPRMQVSVYEIPLTAPALANIGTLTEYPWIHDLIRDPQSFWTSRLSCPSGDERPERLIAEALADFEPATIVLCDDYAACGIVPPGYPDKSSGIVFIGQRPARDPMIRELSAHGFEDAEKAAGFLEMLWGFREGRYPEGGGVEETEINSRIIADDSAASRFGIELTEEWNPCLQVFWESTGDLLFVNSNAEVGWWQHETQQFVPFCETVDELALAISRLLVHVNDYNLKNPNHKCGGAFDSWDGGKFLQ
ncbi:MAG: hypothetical protein ACKVT0_11515 [Planctomycetaceae bacterium]